MGAAVGVNNGSDDRGRCEHVRGGYRRLHGTVAKKYFKPVKVNSIGPGEVVVNSIKKRMYYECEPMRGRRGGPRQSQLSFGSRRAMPNSDLGEMGDRGGCGRVNNDFSSTTAGQNNDKESEH